MAFSTVTGSNGVTSLVGTTGVDTATIVTLESNTFVGGNTGDDNITLNLGTAGQNASDYNVRMGGGDDQFTATNTILNSFVSLDGETLANDGDDTYTGGGNLIINSEIVGRGGNDSFTGMNLNGSTLNGNTGTDTITIGASATAFVYGGRDTDTITLTANSSAVLLNGNKGSDAITVNAVTFSNGSVYGGAGNDTINMNSTTDGVLVSGDNGIDTINTAGGDDTINGGADDDTINAAGGTDTIDGGAGADNITGGAGADTITGGAGNDTFVYTTLTDSVLTSGTSNTGFDTIADAAYSTSAFNAAANGDRFDVTTRPGAVTAAGVQAGGANLGATLTANFGALAVNAIGTITINGGNSFDGNYIVINDGTLGYAFAADAVIKVNTLTGISTDTFV